MKKKFLITGVNYGHNGYPSGFTIDLDISTGVDPFIFSEFVDEPKFKTQKEASDWYESKVGKHLFCDDIVIKAIATSGKTYIV